MMVFKRNINKKNIELARKFLIKMLSKFDILILDNENFYKNGIIMRLLRKSSCGLCYLPPYSPDLNPI